jgi:hypothetical protein
MHEEANTGFMEGLELESALDSICSLFSLPSVEPSSCVHDQRSQPKVPQTVLLKKDPVFVPTWE